MIGCYFTNWSQHRKDEGKFLPKHIDPHLCTHAYFAFANIDVEKMRLAPFENNDMNSTSKSPVPIRRPFRNSVSKSYFHMFILCTLGVVQRVQQDET